jgi:ribulose-phosphate 3-epimerase
VSGSIQIAPSILSADPLNLERDVRALVAAKPAPEWLHVDVMDGHFVPNLTIGPTFVKSLKKITNIELDVHLMVDNPAEQIDWYLDAGARLVTIHVETAYPGARGATKGDSATITALDETAIQRITTMLRRVQAAGALAGLSLNPNTDVALLKPFYNSCDLVLLMSVHPGFGGQSFIANTPDRLDQIRADARAAAATPLIEVDGGINTQTAALAAAHGADILVAGNAIFAQPDPVAALQAIKLSGKQAVGQASRQLRCGTMSGND